jgi:hypothetical protein
VVDDDNLYYMTINPAAGGWQVQSLPKAAGTLTVIGFGSQIDMDIDQFVQEPTDMIFTYTANDSGSITGQYAELQQALVHNERGGCAQQSSRPIRRHRRCWRPLPTLFAAAKVRVLSFDDGR